MHVKAREVEQAARDDIAAAKTALDTARLLGDQLRIDLAESALNSLLDRYHASHTSQRRDT